MPKAGKRLGFEDLSPSIVATQLFGHLEAGSKVAIVTYHHGGSGSNSGTNHHLNETRVYPYVQALQARGLVVRVVTPILATSIRSGGLDDSLLTTDMHDFCFLLHAQKELVGMAKSTYVFWAAVLGQAQRVRLYSIDSDATRKAQQHRGRGGGAADRNHGVFLHYHWTHPDLQRRIHFELYRQEEQQ
jgi:hypothetical protein